MKKLLYGTTALAAAGMIAGSASAAEQIKMGVGGYFQAFIVAGDQDDGVGQPGANLRGHKISREGELIFNGSTTLDNGLQFGVQVQLEAEVCGDQIDESFMWVSGSFGRINIGSENSAAYLMHYAAPAPSHWAHGLNSPNHSHAAAGGNAAGRAPHTLPNITSDSEKITYFTPRLAGFQLGASYTPENCEEVTAGTACGGTYAGFGADNNANQQSEIIELGVNYVNKLGPVDLAVSGSYGQGNIEAPTAGNSDREEWSLGFNVGFSGFTIGGAYRNDDLGLSTGNSEQHDYNLGVRYATGPWGVGLAWARITREAGPGLGEDETDAYELGGSYNLGPGIVLSGGIQYWDLEDNLNAAANENQATIFFVGTHLQF
jgi:predicted porin